MNALNRPDAIDETIRWYVDHRDWWEPLRTRYQGQRLGLAPAAGKAS